MSDTCLAPNIESLSISMYICIYCSRIVTKRISDLLVAYFVYLGA